MKESTKEFYSSIATAFLVSLFFMLSADIPGYDTFIAVMIALISLDVIKIKNGEK